MNECKQGNWGGGDFILVAKNMGGFYSPVYKNDNGDSFRGGFVRIPVVMSYRG